MQSTWVGMMTVLASLAVAGWLFAVGIGLASKAWSYKAWMAAGLLALAGLLVPTSLLISYPNFPGGWSIKTQLLALVCFLPAIALLQVSVLLYTGMRIWRYRQLPGQGRADNPETKIQARPWLSAFAWLLAAVLLGRAIYNLYWLLIWDRTVDGLDVFWILIPVLTVVFSGLLMSAVQPGQLRVVGIGFILVGLGLLVGIYLNAKSTDIHRLTEQRAARIGHAVERFRISHNRYPSTLQELQPWFLLSVPGPVLIPGLDWCYLAGEEYYQLGAVTRDHWSSPYYEVKVFQMAGIAPALDSFCAQQVAVYERTNPLFSSK